MGAGFGMVGLAHAAARGPHFPAKAKRVIFLFLNGGMSQVDTFDPKPMLIKHDGEPMPGPKIKTDRASGNLMRSPFEFKKCGQSGMEVSEIFPQVGARIDDFCVIRSMYSDNGNHGPSLLMMNCGHGLPGPPVAGLLADLRPGNGEPEPAGLHRAVPGLSGAGRAALGFGVSAVDVSGRPTSPVVRRSRPGCCRIFETAG